MSKAFTREKDDDGTGDDAGEEEVAVPAGKNYMTRAGADALRAELRGYLDVERPEVVRVVSWAAGNGDRSENGDYLYGKRRLREIDRRIRYLTKRIESAVVVDCEDHETSEVRFGAWVKMKNLETDVEREIRIVGADETDPKRGFISWQSPLARAALAQKVGEEFSVRTPRGEEDYAVVAIRYRESP